VITPGPRSANSCRPAQEQLIGLQVIGRRLHPHLPHAERIAQGIGNGLRDLLLDGENIFQLTVVRIGPHLLIARCASISCAEMRTRGPWRRTEPSSTCATPSRAAISGTSMAVPRIENADVRDATRNPVDAGENVQHLLRDPVGEIRVLRIGRQVGKRQHGDRMRIDFLHGASSCTLGLFGPPPPTRAQRIHLRARPARPAPPPPAHLPRRRAKGTARP
jgi:hypothetical protein